MTVVQRKHPVLSHRPKTSSAAHIDDSERDDARSASASSRLEIPMKRTASQTFQTAPAHACCDNTMPSGLGAVKEGASVKNFPHSHPYHTFNGSSASSSSSLSRASQVVATSYKQLRRRLSTSSSSNTRRPSLASMLEGPSKSALNVSSALPDLQPPQTLPHHDSGMTTPQITNVELPSVQSRFSTSFTRRLGSIRHRRPAASGPSGEYARFNPAPAPVPSNYPVVPPGEAARASAAAANNERNSQRRDQELTQAFLAGSLQTRHGLDEVMKDSESGVDMSCSTGISWADEVEAEQQMMQEKRIDPIVYLPNEINEMVLSKLDAATLISAELVSKRWRASCTSKHVWKNVFLRDYQPEQYVEPRPILMGGAGIGPFLRKKPAPGQDWKTMYRARLTINRRWKGGQPSAIYLNGHTDSVYCCQFDEDKIITGSRDRTIRVWDMKTYKCTKVIGGPSHRPLLNTPPKLEVHKEMVIDHPSMNGRVDGNAIYRVPTDYHEASILCLQYDSHIMITGSSDHTCIVWDITGQDYVPITRLRGHTAGVLDVALDERFIVSCSKDAAINVWCRKTFKHIRTLTGHRGPVNAVQLRGNLLVSASGDGVAKLWNLDSGACIKEFPSQDRGLAAVEFSDDAKYVLAGGNDHVVYKFDALNGQLLHTSAKHGGLVRSLFLDAHNGRTISGSYDQSIRIADYNTGEIFGAYENWTTSWILSAKSDYRRVVATSQDGRALILDFGWNVQNNHLLIGGL